jgi:polysaccharide chain length determinant protein (PEP-CTERM system associated)
MRVEFRQRGPGEYLEIAWRRKWMIVMPAVAVALAVGYVVWKLPNVYESTTLLTVRPSSISTSVVPRISDSDLTIRINNIGQEVTSRSSLEPLIERYDLYQRERWRGEPMDALVERMRSHDIRVEVNTSRDDITNGFYLSFRGSDPRTTQAVTAELATKYINAQTSAATSEATQTKEFFAQRLQQAKDELEAVDRQRLDAMMKNKESLPSTSEALVGQLAGLREEQKSVLGSLAILRERRSLLTTQHSDLEKQREQEINNVAEQVGDPKQSLAYAELVKRKAELESAREQLLMQYKPKHPDVLAKQAEINTVQRSMDEMVSETRSKVDEKRKRLELQIDPRTNSIKYELQSVNAQAGALEKRLATNESQIADIERRLNNVPNTEVELEAINREYLSRKSIHDDLLAQKGKADIVAGVTANAQGETIAVIDAANLPEKPVAPNRLLLVVLGLVAGLGTGLVLAALFEVPRLLRIQTADDAAHYSGLPILITLPNMWTPREDRRRKLRRAAFAFAGFAAAILAVPALIIILRVTQLVEIFASKG